MPPLHQVLDGLPSALGDDLIRVSAQDHYTEVVTTEGTHLLTARFSDCIEQLDAYDGVQTHRSHWVSLKHVRDLKASGSAYECVLSNGERIPISRRRYAALKHLIRARVG